MMADADRFQRQMDSPGNQSLSNTGWNIRRDIKSRLMGDFSGCGLISPLCAGRFPPTGAGCKRECTDLGRAMQLSRVFNDEPKAIGPEHCWRYYLRRRQRDSAVLF